VSVSINFEDEYGTFSTQFFNQGHQRIDSIKRNRLLQASYPEGFSYVRLARYIHTVADPLRVYAPCSIGSKPKNSAGATGAQSMARTSGITNFKLLEYQNKFGFLCTFMRKGPVFGYINKAALDLVICG
jgi:hypothetical protein